MFAAKLYCLEHAHVLGLGETVDGLSALGIGCPRSYCTHRIQRDTAYGGQLLRINEDQVLLLQLQNAYFVELHAENLRQLVANALGILVV